MSTPPLTTRESWLLTNILWTPLYNTWARPTEAVCPVSSVRRYLSTQLSACICRWRIGVLSLGLFLQLWLNLAGDYLLITATYNITVVVSVRYVLLLLIVMIWRGGKTTQLWNRKTKLGTHNCTLLLLCICTLCVILEFKRTECVHTYVVLYKSDK